MRPLHFNDRNRMTATENKNPASTVTIPVWALWALFILYALPGTVDHGPWRGDDGTYFGVVHAMLSRGAWLAPTVAGHPNFDFPPLYYWTGAVLGKLLGWLITLPAAARLATPVWTAVMLYCLARTARQFNDKPADRAAVLLGMGTLGLLMHVHEFQPQLALLGCTAAAFWGFAQVPNTRHQGALVAGGACGAAFLAGGLPALLLLMPLWAILPAYCPEFRQPERRLPLLAGAGLACAIAATYPLLLLARHPDMLAPWWHAEVADIAPHLGHVLRLGDLLQLMAWFAWPLWPLAGWVLWRERRAPRRLAHVLPIAAFALALAVVTLTGPLRPAHTLPLIPPLILLAARGIGTMKRGAVSAFDWFGRMSFVAFGAFVWLAWYALHFGWPRPLARNVARLVPDFVPSLNWLPVGVAIVLTIGWLALVLRPPRSPLRGALSWAAGLSFLWVVLALLFLPFVDRDKNYRPVAEALRTRIAPRPESCVAEQGMGDAQRAGLLYFANIELESFKPGSRCLWLVVYRGSRDKAIDPPGIWHKVWDNKRGRRKTAEQFTLYRRG